MNTNYQAPVTQVYDIRSGQHLLWNSGAVTNLNPAPQRKAANEPF